MPSGLNLVPEELSKFDTMALRWWDPLGDCRPLHEINPTRLQFITDRVSLSNLKVLDIGCGGGILAESMAKRGADVIGIDASLSLVEVARLHALESDLKNVSYLETTAEEYAAMYPAEFDVITCMELLEHVPDPALLIASCAKLVKPNGHLFFSTLNRNPKAYLLAILGAEYVLKLLPKHTHSYEKFIRPSELENWLRKADLSLNELAGIHYNPFFHRAKLTSDISVNYLAYAVKEV
jgi:2-polyprenyl-6-hydroxyphenyl methylase/3-demethylubiquinone-9 3-methyltransferase